VAECRLTAERVLPGTEEPQRTVHFTGSVRLAPEPAAGEETTAATPAYAGRTITPDEVYRLYFHGPAYQVVASGWLQDGGAAGRFADHLPADRADTEVPTVLSPRLEELCFQVAGLWEAGKEGRLALPAHVDRLTLHGRSGERENVAGMVALAHPAGEPGVFDCVVVDPDGHVVLRLEGYRTIALPGPLTDDVRLPLQRVMDEGRAVQP
jgi:hypothetical protein